MINKIHKIIHNKYLRFFKFFFFLRYVLAIFLISISLFILIPKFFNYEKKQEILKQYLSNNYNLKLNDYESIKYNVFPLPNLSIKKASLIIQKEGILLKSEDLNIFLSIKNIYRYENFKARKIILKDTNISLKIDSVKKLLTYFDNVDYKFDIKDLNLNLLRDNKSLFEVKKVTFSNYGYKKYKINGKVFEKKFKAYFNDKALDFKILNTGIKANLQFDENSSSKLISGSSKISFPKNNLKFNFKANKNLLEMFNSTLRNKDLSITFKSFIEFNPFFYINSVIDIKKINKEKIKKFDLINILSNKNFIKKINSDNIINYKSKKFSNDLIKTFSTEINLAYGRLVFLKNISIVGGNIQCKGDSSLVADYPRLNFDCSFKIENTKKLFKKFSLPKEKIVEKIDLNVEGSINLLNKKINFKKISESNGYVANEEDIKYFKESFENILFNKNFFGIFEFNKIKDFVSAII